MKKARVMITQVCNRDCSYCCNTAEMMAMSEVKKLDSIRGFDEVMITGGEPLLRPEATEAILDVLRRQNPDAKFYLYTAWCPRGHTDVMRSILSKLDGIQYTLHTGSSEEDIERFARMEELVSRRRWGGPGEAFSARLYIVPGMWRRFNLQPDSWTRIEKKPWVENCPLPEGETLITLETS